QERDVGHIRSRQDKSGSAMGGRSAVNSRPKKHVLFSLRRVMASSTNNIEDEVRRRAYELWEQYGRPEGGEEEFWLKAEREIKQAKDLNGTAPESSNSDQL